MRLLLAAIAAVIASSASLATARAQSCTVDPQNVLIVQGTAFATIITADSTSILVNDAWCGDPADLNSILLTGTSGDDVVYLMGRFIPGRDYEADFDELEIVVDLGDGDDFLEFSLGDGPDYLGGGAGSTVYTNTDSDADVTIAGVEDLYVLSNAGDDTIDFTAWDGTAVLNVNTDEGNDIIRGSSAADVLHASYGVDEVHGNGGDDILNCGSDGGVIYGDGGNDDLRPTGFCHVFGGAGVDFVDYSWQSNDLNVTIGSGSYDDGAAGDFDWIEGDVENVFGGNGDDVLVGNAGKNRLEGDFGNDTLSGGGGLDTLYGGEGDDNLFGDAGADRLYGEDGNDSLDGGIGNDKLYGGFGSDVLDGGAGTDAYYGQGGNDFLYNNDGITETVSCGPGTGDDAEVDPAPDTLIDCEL